MRGTKSKRLAKEARELGIVDPKKALVVDIHKNGMHTLRYLRGSTRRIYKDMKKGI